MKDLSREYLDLLHQNRQQCLWFLAPDVVPAARDAQLYTLECLERYGSREVFIQARKLKAWLLQDSNAAFAVT